MQIREVRAVMPRDGRSRPEAIAQAFGHNLWRCRREAGLTQEELANLASVHRTEICVLEKGTRVARVDTLIKLAAALSVSPVRLIEGISWAPGIGFGLRPSSDSQGTLR